MKKTNKITGIDFMFKPEFKNTYIIVRSAEVEDSYSRQHDDGSAWAHASVTLWCKWHNQVKNAKLLFGVKETEPITASELYMVASNVTNSLMVTENMSYNDAFKAIAYGINDAIGCKLYLMEAGDYSCPL